MPAQGATSVELNRDRRQSDFIQMEISRNAGSFDLNAECEVLKLTGRPRIINVDGLVSEDVAGIANSEHLANIILTTVCRIDGPARDSACTQDRLSLYHSQLRVPLGLVCGITDGDVC